ncbi:MAG: flagellar export chaperone FlgN [Planctomycetota bacterium]|nr:flagellar export chaperone FlgN [Planctomycetota bacterium]
MRDPRAIALHLCAWAREELEGQQAALALLERQERAVRDRDLAGMETVSAELGKFAAKGQSRAKRRNHLLGMLAGIWQVPQRALTLGSVVERLGTDGKQLAQLRQELRDGAAQVMRTMRKVGALVAAFRRVTGDVVELLLTDEDGTSLTTGGALVDAEA